MGMHFSIKGLAEHRVIEELLERTMARVLAHGRSELCAVLWRRVFDMGTQ